MLSAPVPEVPVDDPTTGPTPSPARSQKRGPRVRLKPEERQLRGELVMMKRLSGQRMAEIAADLKCSTSTVERALAEARRNGVFDRARDFVAGHLLPKALAVYDQALDEMNVEVARDVLQGLGLVGRQLKVEVSHDVKEDFDAWRLKKTQAIDAITIEPTPNAPHPSTDSTALARAGDGPPEEQPYPRLPAEVDPASDLEEDDDEGVEAGRLPSLSDA